MDLKWTGKLDNRLISRLNRSSRTNLINLITTRSINLYLNRDPGNNLIPLPPRTSSLNPLNPLNHPRKIIPRIKQTPTSPQIPSIYTRTMGYEK
jgi:hypothetical protein